MAQRRSRAMTASMEKPKSVLVYVGLDRVGDGLLKLPFVRGLRDAWPDAQITWVAGRETSVYAGILAPVVEGLLDEVIENAGIGLRPGEILSRPLGGRRFDLVIDSQRVFWASLVLRRIPHRAFISPAAGFLLSSRKPQPGYKFPKSMQRQLLDLLELASGKTFPTPDTLDIHPGEAVEKEAAELLPTGPVYVGFAPGAGGPPKRWPLENFIAVAKAQTAKGRTPVFFLGPKEQGWLDEIKSAVADARFPEHDAGIGDARPFNPMFPIALAKRLAASLSNDSGIGHMLALGGRPLVSLFGRTLAEKFMPMSPALTVIRAQDFGGREMDAIPVAAVMEALEKALAKAL